MTKATYSNITVYAPLQSSYGFLPASKWPDFMPSLIWTAMTDKGSRVVTWEGARLDRDVTQPVSFQAEFHENGEVAYRYDMFPTNDVDTPGGEDANIRNRFFSCNSLLCIAGATRSRRNHQQVPQCLCGTMQGSVAKSYKRSRHKAIRNSA